jgi:predicted porin
LEIGDLTIGGSYKDISDADSANANTNDEEAYEAGIQYAMGDAKIGMGFVNGVRPATSTVGDDEATQYALGASLVIGPGVDLLGTLIHVEWDDEGTAAANNNDGWAVVGGIKVSF